MPQSRRISGNTWKLQDAKARFSELVDTALARGPQTVTRRGEQVVVIVPADQWRQSSRSGRPTLKDLLLHGPKDDDFADLVAARRKVKLRPPPAFE